MSKIKINDHKQQAFLKETLEPGVYGLTGGAGTGKTMTLCDRIAACFGENNILGISPTHKSSNVIVDRLTDVKGDYGGRRYTPPDLTPEQRRAATRRIIFPDKKLVTLRTVQSVLGKIPNTSRRPKNYKDQPFMIHKGAQGKSIRDIAEMKPSLIFVDEMSMISLEDFRELIGVFKAAKLYDRVPIILAGDYNQLPPVEGNPCFREICNQEKIPIHRLKTCHRQKGGGREMIEFINSVLSTRKLPSALSIDSIHIVGREKFKKMFISAIKAEGENPTHLAYANAHVGYFENEAYLAGGRSSLLDIQKGDRIAVCRNMETEWKCGVEVETLAFNSEYVDVLDSEGIQEVKFPWLSSSYEANFLTVRKDGKQRRCGVVNQHNFSNILSGAAKVTNEQLLIVCTLIESLKNTYEKRKGVETIYMEPWFSTFSNKEQLMLKKTETIGILKNYMVDGEKIRSAKVFMDRAKGLLWARCFYGWRDQNIFPVASPMASTVHRSQGSEYPAVFVDFDNIDTARKDKEALLYTALSRAQKEIVICCEQHTDVLIDSIL